MTKEIDSKILDICNLDCKKHVKIYLISQFGVPIPQIAGTLGTNYGHVYNVLKDYRNNPVKVVKAIEIFNPVE